MKKSGIYIITNKINGKRYIGQSIDLVRRSWDHRCLSHESNRHLKHALAYYGKESFDFDILEECSAELLDEREMYYIALLKPEYNVSPGGSRSIHKHAEETIEIIREKAKTAWLNKTDEEKRYVLQNQLIGPKKGHAVSKETRQKLREANLGKKQSAETITKRRETLFAKYASGYVKDNSYRHKPVLCVETNEAFPSVKAAAERFGISPTRISSVLHGRQQTTAKYHFVYCKSVETIPDECKEVGLKMSYSPKCETHEKV